MVCEPRTQEDAEDKPWSPATCSRAEAFLRPPLSQKSSSLSLCHLPSPSLITESSWCCWLQCSSWSKFAGPEFEKILLLPRPVCGYFHVNPSNGCSSVALGQGISPAFQVVLKGDRSNFPNAVPCWRQRWLSSTRNPCWILCGICTAEGIAGPCVWQGEKCGGVSGAESPLGIFGFQQKLYTWLHRHISLPWWMYKIYMSINLLLGALRFPLMTCVPQEPGKARFFIEMPSNSLRTSQHLTWLMASRRSWGWILTVQTSWQVTESVAPPVQPQVQLLPVQQPRTTALPAGKSSWCYTVLTVLKNGSDT